jgi:hypothetical protein
VIARNNLVCGAVSLMRGNYELLPFTGRAGERVARFEMS